jgi:putative nucleotidyltransferase with HDIG domain
MGPENAPIRARTRDGAHRQEKQMKELGGKAGRIDISRGPDVDPLLAAMAAPVEAAPGESKEVLPVTPKAPPSLPEPTLQTVVNELEVSRTMHEEALSIARDIFNAVGSGAPINSPVAREVVTNLLSAVTRSPEASLLLTQMRRFQNDLASHSVNVCVLSLVVGAFEGLEDEVSTLGIAALLHDIGQTRLPRKLTHKNGEFTETERRIMEQHPGLGALIVKQSENIPEAVRRIVLEHHERLNGSGYPCGLRRSEIAFLSQIVAITDVYDAMLTGRNQPPAPPVEVLRQLYLQGSAGAFDRNLVKRIIDGLGAYPIGSLVELNTGERGIVVAPNRIDSLKPTLRVVVSRDALACLNGPIINLAETNAARGARRIVRALDPAKEGIDVMAHLKLSAA